MVQIRDAVDRLCAEIDSGRIQVDEQMMLAIAEVVSKDGGFLTHDLLCKLASRSRIGREALRDQAH
jgi:hypothetical protein